MSPQQQSANSFGGRLVLFILLAIASIFIIKSIYALGVSQWQGSSTRIINGKRLADKEPLSERTAFTENGPTGRWSASIIPDLSRNSSTSPVVVTGTATLMGNAEWRNLQLTHVTLKNYSSKTVLGVQLKWFITRKSDPTKTLPPPDIQDSLKLIYSQERKRNSNARLLNFHKQLNMWRQTES